MGRTEYSTGGCLYQGTWTASEGAQQQEGNPAERLPTEAGKINYKHEKEMDEDDEGWFVIYI